MHYHKTYMYINCQQNWINKSVITVHTNLFAKFASCINLQLPIVIFKNRLFQTCIIVKRTCISNFSKIGLVDQSKQCAQSYLQKKYNCINLQLAIRISKNHTFRTFRPILGLIGLLDVRLPRKEINYTDGRTDGRTDGTTDGRTDRHRE